jgi:hypothetical protein
MTKKYCVKNTVITGYKIHPYMTYFKHYSDLECAFFGNLSMDLICVALVIVFAFRFLSVRGLYHFRSKVIMI